MGRVHRQQADIRGEERLKEDTRAQAFRCDVRQIVRTSSQPGQAGALLGGGDRAGDERRRDPVRRQPIHVILH